MTCTVPAHAVVCRFGGGSWSARLAGVESQHAPSGNVHGKGKGYGWGMQKALATLGRRWWLPLWAYLKQKNVDRALVAEHVLLLTTDGNCTLLKDGTVYLPPPDLTPTDFEPIKTLGGVRFYFYCLSGKSLTILSYVQPC